MTGISRVAVFGLSVLLLLEIASAYCPNGCNGQGTCGKNDKCTCYTRADEYDTSIVYPAFVGPDCSQRTCPYGDAWVATPKPETVASGLTSGHHKVQCSNRGLCDYSSGHCECFPGYDGKACERTVCPNNCNNHGICMTLRAIAAGTVPTTVSYAAWDADKHMGCFCDLGYRGPDCSLKECPSGPDVLLAYGATEGRDCGGRGRCNYDTGECDCFPGYYGTWCSSQTTVN